ncbi:hypothetical protein M9458_011217, partial [Cirrhinus mrigala]
SRVPEFLSFPVFSFLAWPSHYVCLAAFRTARSFHGLFPHLAPHGLRSPRIDPRLPLGLFLCLAPYIPVCYCFDPACSTMFLSRPVNKSSHLNPLASRLFPHVTEYSVTQGSSSFFHGQSTGMDTTRILFRLRQGPRTLEQYIREFLAIANHSALPDCTVIEIFCDGVNEPLKARLRREGLRSSLAAFMDFALLSVGSSFTVGVAEEEHNIAVGAAAKFSQPRIPGHFDLMITTPVLSPARQTAAAPEHVYIMAATTDSVRKMAAAPVHAHVMAAMAEPVHKMAAKTELRHVTAATPEPSKAKAAFPESSRVTAAFPESSQVAAVFPESSQVAAVFPVSSQVAAVFPESSQVTVVVPVSSQVTAVSPESSKVTAVAPVSGKATAVSPKSSQDTAVVPVSSQATAAVPEAVVPEPSQVRAVVPEPSQVRAVVPESSQSSKFTAVVPESSKVTAVIPESSKAKAVVPEPSQVTAGLHEPGQVTADLHESSQVTSDLHNPGQVTTDLHEPSQASDGLHEPGQVTADLQETVDLREPSEAIAVVPESNHVPSDRPESSHIPFDRPESGHVSSDTPEPRHFSSDTPSVLDPPLVSLQAANIPLALGLTNPTIKESAPEVSADHKFAPEIPSVHKSAPEVLTDHESAPAPPEMIVLAADSPKGVTDTTIETPEVAAFAAEPLEVAASTAAPPGAVMPATVSTEVAAGAAEPQVTGMSVLAPCTVVAPNNPHPVSVLMPVPELAVETAYELSPCPVPAIFGLSAPPVTATKATNELSAFLLVLSASSVRALPRSQFMTRVPALPWRASATPPVPPAPPWRAPALPVLPQSPGPPQGPGPPTLALFRCRPTAPLDCWWAGVSGSRSLVGGFVMNLVGDLRSTHHQMSLSPCHITQTVTLHPGLRLPSLIALIAPTPVANQARYKSPGLSPCISQSIV